MHRTVRFFAFVGLGLAACGDDSTGGTGGTAGSGPGTGGVNATSSDASSGSSGLEDLRCALSLEGASSGASPGGLQCFSLFICPGFKLSVSCDGHEDGTATCTCGKDEVELGTCEQRNGVACELESTCCVSMFVP